MRKVFTSLILLLLVQAIAPAAAWANPIVFGPSNSQRATKHSHEQHRDRYAVLERRVLDLLDRQQCVERNRTCKLEFDLLPDT
jgi:hypothetical protein